MLTYARNLVILMAGLFIGLLIQGIIGGRLKRRSEAAGNSGRWWIARLSFQRVAMPLFYLGVARLSLEGLRFSDSFDRTLRGIIAAVIAVLVVRAISFLLSTSLNKYSVTTGREDDERRLKPLLSLVSFILWMIAGIFLLDNLGFNISTLVAGLGVSGIAVAIAAQGILGDLFNYFVIFFDRPFELGDFIIFEDKMGSIEKIGIKTTRIRALSGEQLIISNSGLVNAKVHNYKRMQRRRILFRIGVTYQTDAAKLERIPAIIRSAIEAQPEVSFDRSHFSSFGDFALIIETVYYVESPDYAVYMDRQQAINMIIMRTFAEEGIEFAYPTQTLYLQTEPSEEKPSRIGFTGNRPDQA